MGAYKKAVITDAGRALVARAVAGETEIRFSHASTSEYVYPDGTRFEEIETLEGVRQTVLPADARVHTTEWPRRPLFSISALQLHRQRRSG